MTSPASPELLAPAGSLAMLRTAFTFGADAVYAGQPRYSLRVRNNSFARIEALAEGVREAHARGKAFYVVNNIYAHNSKVRTFLDDLAPVIELAPDALIMADPGLMLMVRERWPDMPLHLSVQANTTNFAAVRFWQSVGVRRVILSRELSLEEIGEIRAACPDMELEVFVHGALCVAYSGRCLLSGYFNHRDPNQGTCTNSCRWDYTVHAATEDAAGDTQPAAPADERHPLAARTWLLEEGTRPGELMPVEEDEHGTYVLNSRDLRAVEHVQQLVALGVHSLKIEGRTKSPYYVARTCQSYRRAIDDAMAGRTFDPRLLGELEGLANRGYTSGFYQRHATQAHQNYLRGHSESGRSLLVGEVIDADPERRRVCIEVKNRFAASDRLEFVMPHATVVQSAAGLSDGTGAPLAGVAGSGRQAWLAWPPGYVAGTPCFVTRLLQ